MHSNKSMGKIKINLFIQQIQMALDYLLELWLKGIPFKLTGHRDY